MRAAGRKNPGAWYRYNKFIQDTNLTTGQRTGLQAIVAAASETLNYISAMQAIALETGAEVPTGLGNAEAFATTLTHVGCPLQCWMGKLTFDTYTKDSEGKYKPDNAPEALRFGAFFRDVANKWMRAQRELLDVENISTDPNLNPSKTADANKAD